MKVIFLDIDGVLTSEKSEGNSTAGFDMFSVDLLIHLCQDTGAKIVITSDRRGYDLPQTLANFKYHSVLYLLNSFIVGVTPHTAERVRSNEIKWFINTDRELLFNNRFISKELYNEGIDNYIIIDDIDLSDYFDEKHFIQTDWEIGLRINETNKAKDLLK